MTCDDESANVTNGTRPQPRRPATRDRVSISRGTATSITSPTSASAAAYRQTAWPCHCLYASGPLDTGVHTSRRRRRLVVGVGNHREHSTALYIFIGEKPAGRPRRAD
ncbi:hypothetical protein J6590_012967 [Homalodisca vitripennis]|nr:hypothetical protein J6590_012967 [Homalodisca vitripennis]